MLCMAIAAASGLMAASARDTIRPPFERGADTIPRVAPVVRDSTSPVSLADAERRAADAQADTVPKHRRRVVAVEYSEAYGRRVTWHRWLSYPIIPLFAAQYVLGEQLMADQRGASDATKVGHRTIATATAGLYTFNTVTGLWNLWEGRRDPSGRLRKWVHAALFVTADAGFVYGATLAHDAQIYGQAYRERHRNVELASMGISVVSWAMMLLWKE